MLSRYLGNQVASTRLITGEPFVGNPVGSQEEHRSMVTKRQREILIGTILGDGYLQKTGKRNARLKLEHSERQKDYIFWKYEELKNLMQDKPKRIERYNPIWKKSYVYYRCQSHSMPLLGRYKRYFYDEKGKKRIPENIEALLKAPLSLAVWYMDDGHYYPRDGVAYIYLPKYSEEDLQRLLRALEKNFDLKPKVIYKRGYPCIYFPRQETEKLMEIIKPWMPDFMKYKTPPDPVTTEGAMPEGHA
ncbi:MAG: LAGLIDADG endonuclease [Aquificaceae bacterium]